MSFSRTELDMLFLFESPVSSFTLILLCCHTALPSVYGLKELMMFA